MSELTTAGNSGTRPEHYAQPKHRPEDFSLHPEVQKHTAEFNQALKDRDALRADNQALMNQVQILEAHIAELQHAHDHERMQKERYQRYCVTVQTLIRSISLAAQQANAAAEDNAIKEEPKQIPPVSEIESEIAKVAKQFQEPAPKS